jgi:hypothetical protein
MKQVTPGNAALAVMLIAALAATARWLGFSGDETLTILGAALALAAMIAAGRAGRHRTRKTGRDKTS